MPVARIRTLNPEDASALASELRSMGFQVEVFDPNQPQLTRADLEIELAVCDQQQVLARAAAISAELNADVVVFPGAIPAPPKPIPTLESAVNTESNPVVEFPLQGEPEPLYMLEAGEPGSTAKEPAVETKPALPRRPVFNPAPFVEKLLGFSRQSAATMQNGLSQLKAKASSFGQSSIKHVRSLSEQGKTWLAQTRTALDQRLLETKRRRAEAAELERRRQERAAIAATAREEERRKQVVLAPAVPESESAQPVFQQDIQRLQAENARLLSELHRLRTATAGQKAFAEPVRPTAPDHDPQSRRVYLFWSELRSRLQLSDIGPRVFQIWQRLTHGLNQRNGHLRGAIAGGLAAVFLFIVGMVLANIRAVPPLSRSLTDSTVEEQTPFGASTARPSTSSAKPSPGQQSPAPGATHAEPAHSEPVAHSTPVAHSAPKPSPVTGNPAATPSDSGWHHFQRASRADDDRTDDEVTVKHFAPQPKPSMQQAGLKRYSDQ